MVLDKAQGDELALSIENDGLLYRQMVTPIINNYARKKLKGIYNKSLAIKGILHIVEAGRRSYIKNFGSIGGTVSKETKIYTANQLLPWIDESATYEARQIRKRIMVKKKLSIAKKKKIFKKR